jgi:methionyl aminopeptidase
MGKIYLKTPEEIKIMAEGGKKLRVIKNDLAGMAKVGVSAAEIEERANTLINQSGGKASFKMVPNYSWATCVNVNSGIVHGIPKEEVVFKNGDLVSIDVGLFYEGFHTDTSVSVGVEADGEVKKFLEVGQRALKNAISQARPGARIFDISGAIQDTIEAGGYAPIRALVGHGVGRELHEDPFIPCFVTGDRSKSPEIVPGLVIAIEVMYTRGKPDIVKENDGWTISTLDGKISALFEETVAVMPNGPLVLT